MAEDNHYAADLEELQSLLSAAKRHRVQGILRQEIETLKKSQDLAVKEHAAIPECNSTTEMKKDTEAQPITTKQPPAPVQSLQKTVTPQSIHYITLDRFSYDQEMDKFKIYISLEGASQDKVVADFKTNSFDVKIHDVGGKNYRCGIPKLYKPIIPESCVVLVKSKRILISLRKAAKEEWSDVYYKEDKFKPSKDDKDPMAGIMDLMKNMYEEGDDETKRTIAKAWSESRSGKTSNSKGVFGQEN